jgi:hypothetical protein
MYIGQRATWTNANGAKGQGTVRGIAAQSSNDGLISVWIDPSDQPANILDGMFAQIVLSNEMPASWKLPRTSLIRQGEENFVVSFHKSSNELEVLPVTVVSEDHNSVYVSYEGEGFEAQEIVVAYVNRAFALAEEK